MFPIEAQAVRAFVASHQKRRFLALLVNERGRAKFLEYLPHSCCLDARFATKIPTAMPDDVELELRQLGAPEDCYVIWLGGSARFNRKRMPLGEALQAVFYHSMGGFISCIPGRLAYFEEEDRGERYLCYRPESGRIGKAKEKHTR